jgi:putative hemolysin
MTWAAGVVAGMLVLLAAVLTTAQAAAAQVGSSRIRTMLEEGFSGAGALSKVRERDALVRASVRLVTRLLNMAAVGTATLAATTAWSGLTPPILVLMGVILGILVVGDMLPHAVAAANPVRIGLASAPALLGVARLMRPLTAPAARLEDRIAGGNDQPNASEKRELREIQELGEEEGVLEPAENLLVERAFHLDELTAWDVMVPRVDIFAWKDDLTLGDIVEQLPDVPYSRVPVYKETVDDVTGIVYIREAYERVARGDRAAQLADIARSPFFVPGSLSLAQLLQDFQARRIHMGIVADEFGGTDGLVTLEDVLEELVGEIHDETDVETEEMVKVSPVSLEVDAGIDLRDVNEELDVSLPKDEHRSLNGFILEELGQVPNKGTVLERGGVRIEILEATETQVVRARLTKLAEETEEAES